MDCGFQEGIKQDKVNDRIIDFYDLLYGVINWYFRLTIKIYFKTIKVKRIADHIGDFISDNEKNKRRER